MEKTIDTPIETPVENLIARLIVWVLLNVAGFGIGMGLSRTVGEAVFWTARRAAFTPTALVVGRGVGWAVFGAVVGAAQLVILWQKSYRSGWWVLAGAAGGALGWSWGTVFSGMMGGLVSWAMFGAVAGGVQWLVLRRYVRHAYWWVPVSAVAWAAGFEASSAVGGVAMPGIFGAVFGVITGPLLVWLLERPAR